MGSVSPLSSAQLHILIVGAGIARLSVASALRKAGHRVQVFERSNFNNEVGAAVTITPNGIRVMRQLGFDFETTGGVFQQCVRFHTDSMKPVHLIDLGTDHEDTCGAPHRAYHRGDLHAELLRMARDTSSSEETPAEMFKGVKINNVDAQNATITLDDGTVYQGDLLIGADGLHSVVRSFAIEDDTDPIDTNWNIYRFLLPRQDIMEDEVLRKLKSDNARLMFMGADRSKGEETHLLVWYQCRNGEVQNFAAFYHGENDETKVEDFGHFANKDKVLKLFRAGLYPDLMRPID